MAGLTVNQLRNSTIDYSRKHLKRARYPLNVPRIKVRQVTTTINRKRGTVLFTVISYDPDPRFKNPRAVQILFYNISPERMAKEKVVPLMWKDPVRVRSQSPFYKFCFQYPNLKNGALFGPPRRFTVKGTGRPVNPRNMPGLDKHLLASLAFLKARGLVRAS